MATDESGAPTCHWCEKPLRASDLLLGKINQMPWLCGRCAGRLLASDYFDPPTRSESVKQYIDTLKAQEEHPNAQSSERTHMVKLVNCTPHPVTIFAPDGEDIIMRLPASPQPARVMMTTSVVALLPLGDHGIPVCHSILGPCFDLRLARPRRSVHPLPAWISCLTPVSE